MKEIVNYNVKCGYCGAFQKFSVVEFIVKPQYVYCTSCKSTVCRLTFKNNIFMTWIETYNGSIVTRSAND